MIPSQSGKAAFTASTDAPRVVALRGTTGEAVRDYIGATAERLAAHGVRVAGVVETPVVDAAGPCGHAALRDLATGEVFTIAQDLGRHSTSCNLDSYGLAAACAAVERAIARGADVVLLSKFGKQEAANGGLADAFRAAIACGLPVITSVTPAVTAEWEKFAGSLSAYIAADDKAVDAWWRTVSGSCSVMP